MKSNHFLYPIQGLTLLQSKSSLLLIFGRPILTFGAPSNLSTQPGFLEDHSSQLILGFPFSCWIQKIKSPKAKKRIGRPSQKPKQSMKKIQLSEFCQSQKASENLCCNYLLSIVMSMFLWRDRPKYRQMWETMSRNQLLNQPKYGQMKSQ